MKFKCAKVTYVIPIDLTTKTARNVNNIKQLLCTMINQSGGLPSSAETGPDFKRDDEDEDLIEVPKSEFIEDDNDDNDENNTTGDIAMKEEDDNSSTSMKVDIDQLKLAIPKDKTAPYSNNWIELDNSILQEVALNDYDILAFAIDDELFEIIEAAYDE